MSSPLQFLVEFYGHNLRSRTHNFRLPPKENKNSIARIRFRFCKVCYSLVELGLNALLLSAVFLYLSNCFFSYTACGWCDLTPVFIKRIFYYFYMSSTVLFLVEFNHVLYSSIPGRDLPCPLQFN